MGIEAEKWTNLGPINALTSLVVDPARMFLAQKLSFQKPNPDATELIKTIKVTLEEAVQMVMENEIIHTRSVALILKANQYLKNN